MADGLHGSGDLPHLPKMKRKRYERGSWRSSRAGQGPVLGQGAGERVVIVFEGRDAAGKGGTIKRFREHLNPRGARHVALAKPTEAERGEWYFQRYVRQLPTSGEITLFDRSWYNRAGGAGAVLHAPGVRPVPAPGPRLRALAGRRRHLAVRCGWR